MLFSKLVAFGLYRPRKTKTQDSSTPLQKGIKAQTADISNTHAYAHPWKGEMTGVLAVLHCSLIISCPDKARPGCFQGQGKMLLRWLKTGRLMQHATLLLTTSQ